MQLVISAIKCPPSTACENIVARFTSAGGYAGRDALCILKLPDAKKYVSRKHFQVLYRDGDFFVRVVSKTNEVVINSRVLNFGEVSKVSGGDKLVIGEYILRAEICYSKSSSELKPNQPGATKALCVAHASDNLADLLNQPLAQPMDSLLESFESRTGQSIDHGSDKPVSRQERHDDLSKAFDEIRAEALANVAENSKGNRSSRGLIPSNSPKSSMQTRLHERDAPKRHTLPPKARPKDERSIEWFIRVLYKSMGLSPQDFGHENSERTAHLIGTLLRSSIGGLHALLDMRRELKEEFSIPHRTTISTHDNNPLKHFAHLDEALKHIMDIREHTRRDLMGAEASVNEAVADLVAHQISLMAGTREALKGAIEIFSPEKIESKVKKTGALNRVVPSLRAAKLWEKFVELHDELEVDAEDKYENMLKENFSRAYSNQSKKLKAKRL